jgi:hypothetical protein
MPIFDQKGSDGMRSAPLEPGSVLQRPEPNRTEPAAPFSPIVVSGGGPMAGRGRKPPPPRHARPVLAAIGE